MEVMFEKISKKVQPLTLPHKDGVQLEEDGHRRGSLGGKLSCAPIRAMMSLKRKEDDDRQHQPDGQVAEPHLRGEGAEDEPVAGP